MLSAILFASIASFSRYGSSWDACLPELSAFLNLRLDWSQESCGGAHDEPGRTFRDSSEFTKQRKKMPQRQPLQEEHPIRLAIRMLGLLPTSPRLPLSSSQKREGTKDKSPTGPCKPRRLVSFFHFFSKKNCGSFRKIIAWN